MSASLQVSRTLDRLGGFVAGHPQLWIGLGNIESKLLSGELQAVSIQSPIFICGLARSGSTMLLELLAAHPDVATHRYRDFPFVFIPYWWNKALALNPWRDKTLRERAHGDGIMISPDSPEAMEEMLWRAFAGRPGFDNFYRAHIKKLLLAQRKRRYAAKNNYNVTRMEHLLRLFPDARFIIPIRDPVSHIASLMRQHRRFCEAGAMAARHMAQAGHFEFGPNCRAIDTGDRSLFKDIDDAWKNGREVQGWALYWDMIYRHLHRGLTAQAMVVRFEDLCAQPADTIRRILQHANLENEALVERFAPTMRAPDYYRPDFSAADLNLIRQITGETAGLFGY